MAIRLAVPMVSGQYDAINEEVDPQLAERAIPASLKMLEGMVKSDPENKELLLKLAEGFCSYAFSFVEDDAPQRASGLYLRGRDFAVRTLALSGHDPVWIQQSPDDFNKTLNTIDPDDFPALFWFGQCWSGWLMLNLDDLEAFVTVPKVEAVMQKVLEWNESFHYAGPHLFFGAFYGARPKMLGGDPVKSREHFEKGMKLTDNKYLVLPMMFAKTLAVQTQDRELFEELLNTVLETSPDVLPEQRLANAVARKKARKLLEAADDLF